MPSFTRDFLVGLASLVALVPMSQAQSSFDDVARREAVEKSATALRNRYVFADVGETAAAKIESNLAAGAYKDLQIREFAAMITADLYEVTNDKHLRVMVAGS